MAMKLPEDTNGDFLREAVYELMNRLESRSDKGLDFETRRRQHIEFLKTERLEFLEEIERAVAAREGVFSNLTADHVKPVHSDLKPQNIITLTPYAHSKLSKKSDDEISLSGGVVAFAFRFVASQEEKDDYLASLEEAYIVDRLEFGRTLATIQLYWWAILIAFNAALSNSLLGKMAKAVAKKLGN